MEERNYCVYMHTSPSGKIYVGMTGRKPEQRWKNGNGYKSQPYFWNAIKKHGWENFKHEILFDGLTKEEADQKEIEMIAYYKSYKQDYGYNLDLGGNSTGKMSDSTKEKLRMAHLGKSNGPLSQESKDKMRESKLGDKNPMFGRHDAKSQETKDKIRESKIGNKNPMFGKFGQEHHNSVPICQCDLEYNVVNIFWNVYEAERETCIKAGNINSVCTGTPTKNGYVRHTAGGYRWRYATKEEIECLKS